MRMSNATITTMSDDAIIRMPTPRTIALITADGEVQIDWKAVEVTADDADNCVASFARILLAARDGDWRPIG
jgi:hypothetical protein